MKKGGEREGGTEGGRVKKGGERDDNINCLINY